MMANGACMQWPANNDGMHGGGPRGPGRRMDERPVRLSSLVLILTARDLTLQRFALQHFADALG